MASIMNRGGRWRALVRKAGHTRCGTFSTRAAANEWSRRIEREIEQLRASGVIQVPGKTIADLIDRYVAELHPVKQWGRSKSADLRRLKADLGTIPAASLTARHLTAYFQKRHKAGSGGVVISGQIGYLVDVLKVARSLWCWDVPLVAAQEARTALAQVGMVTKSDERNRRVSDKELAALVAYFDVRETQIPVGDILRFCLASGMRISEVCRLRWADMNEADKTIIVRDRKHPKNKIGNDQLVPLLDATGHDAFQVAMRQPRDDDRIFPYQSHTIGTYFTRAVKALKLRNLHLHDLRHEAVSRFFEVGYRIEQVAIISGHRDWGQLRRYTQVKTMNLHRIGVASLLRTDFASG